MPVYGGFLNHGSATPQQRQAYERRSDMGLDSLVA